MDSLTAAEPCSVFNQSHDFCDVHPSNQKKNLVCPRGYRPSFSFALNVAIPLSPLLNSQQKQSDSQAKLLIWYTPIEPFSQTPSIVYRFFWALLGRETKADPEKPRAYEALLISMLGEYRPFSTGDQSPRHCRFTSCCARGLSVCACSWHTDIHENKQIQC